MKTLEHKNGTVFDKILHFKNKYIVHNTLKVNCQKQVKNKNAKLKLDANLMFKLEQLQIRYIEHVIIDRYNVPFKCIH